MIEGRHTLRHQFQRAPLSLPAPRTAVQFAPIVCRGRVKSCGQQNQYRDGMARLKMVTVERWLVLRELHEMMLVLLAVIGKITYSSRICQSSFAAARLPCLPPLHSEVTCRC